LRDCEIHMCISKEDRLFAHMNKVMFILVAWIFWEVSWTLGPFSTTVVHGAS